MDATKNSLEWMVRSRECNGRPLSGSEIAGLESTLQLLAAQAGAARIRLRTIGLPRPRTIGRPVRLPAQPICMKPGPSGQRLFATFPSE